MRGQKRDARDRTRALAVVAATGSVAEAERETGIPHQTIHQWLDSDEYGELRQRTKEAVAEEWWAIVQTAFRRVLNTLENTDDPVKVATAGAIVFDKLALTRGEATTRTESRDLNGSLDDHELTRLREIVHSAVDTPQAAVVDPSQNGTAPS